MKRFPIPGRNPARLQVTRLAISALKRLRDTGKRANLRDSNIKETSCSRVIAWSVNDLSALLRPEKKRRRRRRREGGEGKKVAVTAALTREPLGKNGDSWVNLRVESGSLCSGTLPTLPHVNRLTPVAVSNWQPPIDTADPTTRGSQVPIRPIVESY